METHASDDTPRGGVDPESRAGGGSGSHGPDTSSHQTDQDLGPAIGEEDVESDRTGEPTTKPGASERTAGQMPAADSVDDDRSS